MREVSSTVDLARIRALPRRSLSIDDARMWARELTPVFKRPGSAASLRPWQGFALAELAMMAQDGYGLWAVMPVGLGKTMLTYLSPRLVGARRPVLIIPAALRAKTLSDFASLHKDWDNQNRYPEILTVESLARESGAVTLQKKRPDFIAIDECDVLSNPKSSTTRRLDRYVLEHEPIVFAGTGTPTRNSILGYWHIIMWCLRDRAPLPLTPEESATWADALDNKKISVGSRTRPGALGHNITTARAWYCNRLISTPGVMVVDEDSAAVVPITIRTRLSYEDPILDDHFKHYLVKGEILGGIPRDSMTVAREGAANEKSLSDPFSRFRIEGLLGLGILQYWEIPAPIEWAQARTAAAAFVRNMIEQSSGWSRPIDTEGQCFSRYLDHHVVRRWREIKSTFVPDVRVKWITDSTLRACEDWLSESNTPGIIWCGSKAFAYKLAESTGLPYYGSKGLTDRGKALHSARANTSILCSWHANKRGFNLQDWPRQLITLMPPSAKWVEQIIGRSHRAGAKSAVTIDVLATSGATLQSFEAMLSEARFEKETITLTKKVLRARIVRAKPTITEGNRFRWATAD